MNNEKDFFVYRPLLPESATRLERVQKEYASLESFTPVENLHMTILNSSTNGNLAKHRMHQIIDTPPKWSQTSFDAEIIKTQLDSRVRDVTRLAIKLILSDVSDERCAQEHVKYRQAVKKADEGMMVRRFRGPHVTIGYLDAWHGVASVMDAVDTLVGTTLGFGPSESNLGKVRVPDRVEHTGPSTPMEIDLPVRIVQPGSIPSGLLASLQPRDLSVR